jgi:hypothetical protein
MKTKWTLVQIGTIAHLAYEATRAVHIARGDTSMSPWLEADSIVRERWNIAVRAHFRLGLDMNPLPEDAIAENPFSGLLFTAIADTVRYQLFGE